MPKILDPDQLTYIVNGSPTTQNVRFDTTNRTIELVAGGNLVAKDGVTGQCLFSKIKEVIKADANLIKFPLPVREMIYDESMELVNNWKFKDESSLKMVRDCGVAYVNSSGVFTAMFACFVTLGSVITGAPYYTLSSATNASTGSFTHINLGTTFGVNELVQIYSDTNGDGIPDYDSRAYAKVFLREAGYTYSEASVADIGYPSLTYKKYNFPITHSVDPGVTVSDATLAGYTGMSIQWYAAAQSFSLGANGPYNFRVVINGNNRTYDQIYSWVQYQLRQTSDVDAGAGNRTGRVSPALVFMDGATLKTRFQQALGGVHITNPAGSSLNNIAEAADDFTGSNYRTYPYVAAITLEFDEYLVQDGANASFWLFDAATYGTPSAALLVDNNAVPITGTLSGVTLGNPTKSFGFNYSVDKPWVAVAVGRDKGKTAVATGTIIQSTANKGVLVGGQERWYANP
jgi:hypothetical protein